MAEREGREDRSRQTVPKPTRSEEERQAVAEYRAERAAGVEPITLEEIKAEFGIE